MRPAHPCGYPSCPTLVRGRARCPVHEVKQTDRRDKDPEQAKFYGSRVWKAIRSMVIRRDPICKMCHRAPSTTAHHKDNNWRNNDPSNHEGACDPCHRKHSGLEHFKKRRV